MHRPANAMEWTENHDIFLLREILVVEPFKHRKGSIEKGKCWTEIAANLNSSAELKFKVTQRSVRERFSLLEAKFKKQVRDEEAASGISVEISEIDVLLEEITEKEKVAEEEGETTGKGKKVQLEKGKAEEMRKLAMERMGESSKRKNEEGGQCKRKRRSGSDTVEYLREKAAIEKELREKEIELKRAECDAQTEMMKVMQQQQVQGQKMQNMLLQQQQQQNQAMLTILQHLVKKD